MSARTTDNFLPTGQRKTSYVPRSQVYVPRRLVVVPRSPAATPGRRTKDTALPARVTPIVLDTQKPWLKPKGRLSQKKLLYALGLAVLLLGSAVFLTSLRSGRQPVGQVAAQQITVENKPVPAKSTSANIGLPLRLRIPKIGVDATVDHLGLTPKGDMDTPKGPDTVGWFSPGPRPGEIGNAVIDGHFGWRNNLPAVFDNLHTLQKGDAIIIEGEKGGTATFIVRELRTYGREETATDVFRSSDKKAHLNLITCQGTWNERHKSYSNRLVVLTDLLVDGE